MDTIDSYSLPMALLLKAFDNLNTRRINPCVDESSKTILLPIPKNANSFLTAVFLHNSPAAPDFIFQKETPISFKKRRPDSYPLATKNRLLDPGYKKLVVLRRPERRLVSCFLDKIVKKLPMQHPLMNRFLQKKTEEITFLDFFRYVECNADFKRDRHYKTQSFFVRLYPVSFDFVGCFERLDEVVNYLRHNRGMEIPESPHLGTAKSSHYGPDKNPGRDFSETPAYVLRNFAVFPPPDQFIPRSLFERIQSEFKKDFELYNNYCDY